MLTLNTQLTMQMVGREEYTYIVTDREQKYIRPSNIPCHSPRLIHRSVLTFRPMAEDERIDSYLLFLSASIEADPDEPWCKAAFPRISPQYP